MSTPIAESVIDRVRIRIAEPYTGMLNDVDIVKFINEAQDDLMWRLPYPAVWFLTEDQNANIVDGQDFYTFEAPDNVAPDYVMYVSVLYKGKYAKKLEIEDLRKYAPIADVTPSESKPHFVMMSNGIKFLVGTGGPSGAEIDGIQVSYVKRPTPVVLSESDIGYPEHFTTLIEDFVAARGYENRRNYELYAASFQSYYERVDRIVQRYQVGEDVQQYMSKVDRP